MKYPLQKAEINRACNWGQDIVGHAYGCACRASDFSSVGLGDVASGCSLLIVPRPEFFTSLLSPIYNTQQDG
ncbi:hypothetical protein ASPCADRAFT_210505 [Aspergillus carbonarius ITEM 5010]|uniref:Uncharacterized protein n=1 Tax=Aspergillus carbonarius (strain ITEM 5010) TaxID=602072 RepID=A0A1R3RCA5_ASPC5|nr:hypothetical protein ASPCADRAFT_210505 [Aspergillus carbonarius ITEM 5010]